MGSSNTHMEQPRVLCIVRASTHPLINRRIAMIRNGGFQIEAMGFRRETHQGATTTYEISHLGVIKPGDHLRRIPTLIKCIPKLRSALRRSQVVYVFHMDLALLVILSGLGLRRPTAMEIVDIIPIQTRQGLIGKIVRQIEKLVLSQLDLLILTSTGYRDYYRTWLKCDVPDLIIEERIEPSRASVYKQHKPVMRPGVPLIDRKLRIGYYGNIRDRWSLNLLASLCSSSNDRFEIVIAGNVSPKIPYFDDYLYKNNAIRYLGPFRHPEDIPDLYTSADMILACYRPMIPFGWSHATRYFEACFFRKPLIVRAGTEAARHVESHEIGHIIEDDDSQSAAQSIGSITPERWLRWQQNMAALPPDVYMQGTQPGLLADKLNGLLNRS